MTVTLGYCSQFTQDIVLFFPGISSHVKVVYLSELVVACGQSEMWTVRACELTDVCYLTMVLNAVRGKKTNRQKSDFRHSNGLREI